MNNSILLQILIEICQNSAQIDFQGGKNSIYEAIANSEVMPAVIDNEEQHSRSNLVKSFYRDVNTVIMEESVEESTILTPSIVLNGQSFVGEQEKDK